MSRTSARPLEPDTNEEFYLSRLSRLCPSFRGARARDQRLPKAKYAGQTISFDVQDCVQVALRSSSSSRKSKSKPTGLKTTSMQWTLVACTGYTLYVLNVSQCANHIMQVLECMCCVVGPKGRACLSFQSQGLPGLAHTKPPMNSGRGISI
jgi:hypothetical protein